MSNSLPAKLFHALLLQFFLIGIVFAQTPDAPRLLADNLIKDYSSSSSISIIREKLFVIGDDEGSLYILNSNHSVVDSLVLVPFAGKRMPKDEKPDFEASTVVREHGKDCLWVFGSGPGANRARLFQVGGDGYSVKDLSDLYRRFVRQISQQLSVTNFEGVTCVGDQLLFANRGNARNQKNELAVVNVQSFRKGKTGSIRLSQISSPFKDGVFRGVSDVFYDEVSDILFCLFTEEASRDGYNDGAIGDSYIGWTKDAKRRVVDGDIRMDGVISFVSIEKSLSKLKVEGMALHHATRSAFVFHCVADNDDGTSRIITVEIPRSSL